MMNPLLQKSVTLLLLSSVVLSIAVLPLNVHVANAQVGVEEINTGTHSGEPGTQQGCSIFNLFSSSVFGCIILNILWLVDKGLVVTLLNVATYIFEVSVDRNLVDITASSFVRIGWGIVRDIANLFFIFILLWIALATIFDIAGYGAKDLLRQLIIAALLINFSLAIGGFIINFTNTLGRSFLNATAKGGCTAQTGLACGVSDKLLAFTYLQNLTTQSFNIANSRSGGLQATALEGIVKGDQPSITNAIYQALWLIIIIPILSFIFFAAAIFFLARYLMLSVLLVLAPIVFLFMILPDTRSHWNKWWNSLLQWSFFAPVFLFFLFLTILAFNQLAIANISASDKGFLDIAVDMILIIILMVINLGIAHQMGVHGAGLVTGWGNRAAGWVQGAARRGAIRGFAPAVEQFAKTPVGQFMARTPGLRALTQPALTIQKERERLDTERAGRVLSAVRTAPPEFAAQRLAGESRSVQEAVYKSARPEDIERIMKGFAKGEDKSAAEQEIIKLRNRDPKLAERIESSVKDLHLKVVAAKGVGLGQLSDQERAVFKGEAAGQPTPIMVTFQKATDEYLSDQSEKKLQSILTAENIKLPQMESYMVRNFGEREAKALSRTAGQVRAFAETLMKAVEKQKTADFRNQINTLVGQGRTPAEARFLAFQQYAPDVLKNPTLIRWIATSAGVRALYKGVPLRERGYTPFIAGGGGEPAPGAPAGGPAA